MPTDRSDKIKVSVKILSIVVSGMDVRKTNRNSR
jgi:hypothetical protein